MKKIIFALIIVTLLSGGPLLTSAQEISPDPTIPVPGPTNANLWELLARALQWLFNIVIVLAAIFLVVAGLQYVTSRGDENKVKSALNTLVYALIGVAIAILAKSLIYLVGHFLHTPLSI